MTRDTQITRDAGHANNARREALKILHVIINLAPALIVCYYNYFQSRMCMIITNDKTTLANVTNGISHIGMRKLLDKYLFF